MLQKNPKNHLTILGGGPAGLASAYYAKKRSIPFSLYESEKAIGGICRTIEHNNFFFDTGAHRFHDRHPETTQEILNLMKGEISRIQVPSQIYLGGKYIDFPLTPINLIKNLGPLNYARSVMDILRSRFKSMPAEFNFESLSVFKYGQTIAERFLLNYSSKLWGRPCSELSSEIAGNRMKGLDLVTFIKEAFSDNGKKTEHIDGAFYYPDKGYGAIAEKLAEKAGREHIHTKSRVTRIYHDQKSILGGEINNHDPFDSDTLITTIPIDRFVTMMDPLPPSDVRRAIEGLTYRNVILVAFFLDKPSISANGSIYVPSPEMPFNRVYEPRNRSAGMSPPGKTSLVAEIACTPYDTIDCLDDGEIAGLVQPHFIELGWFKKDEIIGQCVVRLPDAYPVLTVAASDQLNDVNAYLKTFSNLKISGRNGKFMYTHLHDQIRWGNEIIDQIIEPVKP